MEPTDFYGGAPSFFGSFSRSRTALGKERRESQNHRRLCTARDLKETLNRSHPAPQGVHKKSPSTLQWISSCILIITTVTHCGLWNYGRQFLNHLLAELKKGSQDLRKRVQSPLLLQNSYVILQTNFQARRGWQPCLCSLEPHLTELSKKSLSGPRASFRGCTEHMPHVTASGCHCNASQAPPPQPLASRNSSKQTFLYKIKGRG